uniref:Uncharacterized protein n=1 Tax=Anguilla anguilla TaxID=7936 RepID=A0A0E9XW08_ANGAN
MYSEVMDSDISAKISNVILITRMYDMDFRVTGQISRAHSKKK